MRHRRRQAARATRIIVVDTVPARLETAPRMGADEVVAFWQEDPVEAIMRLTDGRGVDVEIARNK